MLPADFDARATALLQAGDDRGAIAALREGQECQPHPVLATNLGRLLWRTGALDEATGLLEWATATAPDQAAGWLNLGDALAAADDPRAEQAYRRVLPLVANPAEVHWSIALDLMTHGAWRRAWPHYAWRARHPRVRRRPAPYPSLSERRRAGGRILLWSHEGIGEDLRHVALLPRLIAAGFSIVLEVDGRLVPLFARSFPAVTVVPRSWPPRPATADRAIVAQLALGDLPAWLGLEPAGLPTGEPWLRADPSARSERRRRYAALGPGPIVGVSWQSSGTPFADAKSLDPALLAPLLATDGVTFVDLQYGLGEAARAALGAAGIAGRLHRDPTVDPMTDLDGFAAQVAAVDLVISSSNSTVHMAGGLGVPVWVAIHRGPPTTPYWIAGTAGSPWYPRMRIWRQDRPGDWSGPLASLMEHFALWKVSFGSTLDA